MDPKPIIESHVSDVVRRLPRRQRNDVGFELRSLLLEDPRRACRRSWAAR
jgi:hypothetical protein